MQVKKYDGSHERQLLIGMIVDKKVLAKISTRWERGLFLSRWSDLVATWCVSYYRKYGRAPKKQIQHIFTRWATEHSDDKETIKLLERFLSSLSSEYETLQQELNPDFIIDMAGDYFNRVKMQRTAEQVQDLLAEGSIEKAQKLMEGYKRVELGTGSDVDILKDVNAIKEAFTSKSKPIIKYPGALKNFFGDTLERDGFIAFLGPEKRGKTYWLIDIAWRAAQQGNRVGFFECGDLSQNQLLRRFMIRACGRPLEKGVIKIPLEMDRVGDFATVKEFEEREFHNNLSWEYAVKTCKKILSASNGENRIRLQVHPNSTLTMASITGTVDRWAQEGWPVDVVVIDYADILSPAAGYSESRDGINANWKAMRALSQQYHALVVTATQANAASYKAESIDWSNFSEDKRKLSHVTGMIGINQAKEEKRDGIMRLNWIVRREAAFDTAKHVHVAGCLDLSNPAIRSIF